MLEKVTSSVVVAPTATSPKSTLELLKAKDGEGGGSGGAELELPPPQPAAAKTPARKATCNQLILVFMFVSLIFQV